jgi:FtsZ-binding cell division protein ZapB
MAAVETHTSAGYTSFMGEHIEGMDESWMPQTEILPAGEPDPSILDELNSMEYMSQPAPHQTQQQHNNTNNHSSIPTPPLAISGYTQQSYHPLSSPVTPSYGASTFTSPSLKRKSPMTSILAPVAKRPALLSNFGNAIAPTKAEPVLVVEPLTPSPSHRQFYPMSSALPAHAYHPTAATGNAVRQQHPIYHHQPLSPLCESACSDDEESAVCRPLATSPLPVVSAFQAAKRRALRARLLKRQRARMASKVELCIAVASASTTSGAAAGSGEDKEEDADSVHVDKKTARAIRNRLAASRSRVEAKMKMQSLAEANDELAETVQSLKEENASLQKQLHALLAHTFGDNVPVDDVLSVFEVVKGRR